MAVALRILLDAQLHDAIAPWVGLRGIAEPSAGRAVDAHHLVHFSLHVGRFLLGRGAGCKGQRAQAGNQDLSHRILLSWCEPAAPALERLPAAQGFARQEPRRFMIQLKSCAVSTYDPDQSDRGTFL
jgi:hypothetical protein